MEGTRREFLATLVSASAAGSTELSNTMEKYVPETQHAIDFLDAYRGELTGFTDTVDESYGDVVVAGEDHFVNDADVKIRDVVETIDPDVLAVEFVYWQDQVFAQHNDPDESVPTEQVISRINEMLFPGWERDTAVMEDILETGIDLKGLEFHKASRYPDGTDPEAVYDSIQEYFKERSRHIIEYGKELAEQYDTVVIWVGGSHVDPEMRTAAGLIRASHPEYVHDLTPEDVYENPTVVDQLARERSADDPEDVRDFSIFVEHPEQYTFAKGMPDATTLYATSAEEQKNFLEDTRQAWSEQTKNAEPVQQRLDDITQMLENIEDRQPYDAQVRDKYRVGLNQPARGATTSGPTR